MCKVKDPFAPLEGIPFVGATSLICTNSPSNLDAILANSYSTLEQKKVIFN